MSTDIKWRIAIHQLGEYLKHGCTLSQQGGEWHLFAPGGDGMFSTPDLGALILMIGARPTTSTAQKAPCADSETT